MNAQFREIRGHNGDNRDSSTGTPQIGHKAAIEEFDKLIAEARKQAKQAGMKKSDIKAAIKKIRAEK